MSQSETEFEVTDHNRVQRIPKRGAYDKEAVYAIVDAGLICHVGFADEAGKPFVIPTLHGRSGDEILLHGATTSRMIKHAQAGHDLCITITHVDGIVLARSVFHHSINYRSAVLFGKGRVIESDDEKMAALEAFTEKLLPGRWADSRPPNPTELKATGVVAMPIDLASAKVRTGPPGDDAEDIALPYWAGVVPITQVKGAPIDAPDLNAGIAVPDYLA